MFFKFLSSLFLIFISFTYLFAESTNSRFEINHVVVVCKDLQSAIDKFEKAGFSIEKTGKFDGGYTVNAHIPFLKNNSYIELFAPGSIEIWNTLHEEKEKGTLADYLADQNIMDSRFLTHLAGFEGLADFALSARNINKFGEIVKSINQDKQIYFGPIKMQRERPDGKIIHWIVYVPKTTALPFLIHWNELDETPLSVSSQPKIGVSGIANITVAVDNLKMYEKLYTKILGVNSKKIKIDDENQYLKFNLSKDESITLVSPINEKSKLYSYIKTHGQRPYSLSLSSDKKSYSEVDTLEKELGARINIVYEK